MLPDTPAILVDMDKLENNIQKMASLARENKINLRPHIKTHKSIELARMQLAAGASGITTAKISEAEIFAAAGIDDIFIAYPIIGAAKLERLLALNRKCRLIVGVDSYKGVADMAAAAQAAGQILSVRLEVEIGFARTGTAQKDLLQLASKIAASPALKLEGIYVFKAMTLAGQPTTDRQAAGLEEGEMAVELADEIRAAGIVLESVSIGSTPTAEFAATVPGVTEIRPGTYIFNDMATVKTGACSLAECAASVLVTVVNKQEGRLVVDGGSKTFSTDTAPGQAPLYLSGYAHCLSDDKLVLHRYSEEHGMVKVNAGARDWQVGDQLQFVPNHICTTINLHDSFALVKGGQVQKIVKVAARGCVT